MVRVPCTVGVSGQPPERQSPWKSMHFVLSRITDPACIYCIAAAQSDSNRMPNNMVSCAPAKFSAVRALRIVPWEEESENTDFRSQYLSHFLRRRAS